VDIEIKIPNDSEGFYSLECPYCNERFKANSSDFDAEDTLELFCPSCGLVEERSSFIPKDVIEHAETLALNFMEQEFYNSFKKTFDIKRPKEEVPKLLTENEDLEQIELHCCDKIIKVDIDHMVSNVYCPFCGVN
jgi:uncharacterized Zn-finger protein